MYHSNGNCFECYPPLLFLTCTTRVPSQGITSKVSSSPNIATSVTIVLMDKNTLVDYIIRLCDYIMLYDCTLREYKILYF